MKKALVFILLFMNSATYAKQGDNLAKGSYFLSISSVSKDLSAYSFMIDQILELKCGKSATLDQVGKATETHIHVLIALKHGDYEEAKRIINSVSCTG